MHVTSRNLSRGFSLIEVMVALIVVAIGLLGLAKMESLAMMSTNIAGSRSIAALQASSMAAAMHADRDFWGKTPDALTTVTSSYPNPANQCVSVAAPCAPEDFARVDMYNWSQALSATMGTQYLATIACTTGGLPISCTITIQWTEATASANAKQTSFASGDAVSTPTYSLYVEP